MYTQLLKSTMIFTCDLKYGIDLYAVVFEFITLIYSFLNLIYHWHKIGKKWFFHPYLYRQGLELIICPISHPHLIYTVSWGGIWLIFNQWDADEISVSVLPFAHMLQEYKRFKILILKTPNKKERRSEFNCLYSRSLAWWFETCSTTKFVCF